jgi:hypothetical protein
MCAMYRLIRTVTSSLLHHQIYDFTSFKDITSMPCLLTFRVIWNVTSGGDFKLL